jgi:YidC/Oxa1 family membrane protein insertase
LTELKMSHRVALAVIISVAIMFGYSYLFPPPTGGEQDDAAGETGGELAEGEPAAKPDTTVDPQTGKVERIDPADPSAPSQPDPAAPVAEPIERIEHRIANELLAITVDNQPGGLITGVEPLAEQFYETKTDSGLDFLMLGEAAGAPGRTLDLGFVADGTDFSWSRIPAKLVRKDERSIELSRRQGDVEVLEILTLLDGYEAKYEVVVRNHGQGQQLHRLQLATRMGLGESSRYDVHRALCRTPEDVEDFDYDDVEDEGETETIKGVDWLALDSKYFVQAVIAAERLAHCTVSSDEAGSLLINTGVGTQATLGPGEQKRYVFGLYVGAKVDTMLDAFPASAALSEALPPTDLTDAIDWGWFGRLSKYLGGMMLDLLRWFYGLTGIWGVAIIMLTVSVKLVLLPLTIKQYSSMRKMKELQPEMEKVRQKYGDDKLKQQQEMQALFKRTGVNPLAGCMPMVLQFPVWIALYAMLGAVVDLYHEEFLWLPDLTQPDPYYILPVAMGGLMFLQTRMNPTAGDAAQAKMMMWMMPGIFVVMMLFLPSGLGVYIFANIVLSLIQSFVQLRIKSKDAPKDGAEATGADASKAGPKPGAGKGKGKGGK